MDLGINMHSVWKSLNEFDNKATKLKAECQEDLTLNLKIQRSDADIKKRQEQLQIDRYINSQRKLLDAGSDVEQNSISMAMKASLRDLMTKGLRDQCGAFDEKMKQERTVLNQALSKFIEEDEANIKKERAKVDFMIKKAWEKMDEALVNERSSLKYLIESLVEKEEVRGTIEKVHAGMNEEVEDGIYIPRGCLFVLMDNECDLVDVMRFKVHVVKERYPDLQKYYDSREYKLGQFTITEPDTTIEFVTMLQTLRDFGYRGNAELYYLDPVAGSQPSTGLKMIHEQEEVNELVLAHAEEKTKICHLYLVGPEDDMADMDYSNDGEELGDDGELQGNDREEQGDMSP